MNYAAKRTRDVLAIALAIALAATAASAAQIPSLDEVYRTASAGDLPRADAMMQEVLSAHPNSARAHSPMPKFSPPRGALPLPAPS